MSIDHGIIDLKNDLDSVHVVSGSREYGYSGMVD